MNDKHDSETERCPNCDGEKNQSKDGDHRICWECGTRFAESTRETVGGFTVDTRHKMRVECPACESVEDLYYLGETTDDRHYGPVLGWVCSSCESEVQEYLGPNFSTVDLVEPAKRAYTEEYNE